MNMLDPTAIANPEEYTKDEIKGLCIRRFKKDVKDQMGGKYLERTVNLVSCEASPKEEAVFDIFAQMQLDMDTSKPKGTGQLFKTSLEKSLFSSPKACLKSVEERLRKLRHKYPDGDIKDIALLEELRDALALVEPHDFSRYTKLLELLRSSEYNWNPKTVDDRIVIFTERIETMKFLAKQLREDLHMSDKQVVEISGGMTDMEQQQKEVRKKALKLLEHMDRTEKGLYDRLLRAGFSEALAADAVAYVKDYGYVNDARYATNYIMYRIHDKSRQKIFQELQQKGIDRQTIQSAWDEAAELEMPDERKLLRQMVEKKYAPGSSLDEKEMRRLYGYLARRGFRSGDIFSVLEEMDIS